MKILHIGPGKVHGGVESHILSLTEGFRDTDVECHVVMLNGIWSLPIRVLSKGFRGDWRMVARIRRVIRDDSIDIVHTHYLGPNLYGRLATRLSGGGIGLVTTAHFSDSGGIVCPGKKNPTFADEVVFWLDTVMAHCCDRMVVPSDVIRGPLGKVGFPKDRIVSIPHGIDLKRFRINEHEGLRLRGELGIPDDAVTVGVIGRLVPVKNISLFLSAMQRVIAGYKGKVVGLVVGDGPLRPALEDEAQRLGIGNQVLFTGFRKDIERVFSALDVVAACSDSELSPLNIGEAMAAGRSVVATSVGSLPDTIDSGKDGFLVRTGDAADMAEKLFLLICDASLRERMGMQARKKAEDLFSRRAMIDRLRAVYAEVISERTARPRGKSASC